MDNSGDNLTIDRLSRNQMVAMLQDLISGRATAGQINERLSTLREMVENRSPVEQDYTVNQLLIELQDEFGSEHPNQHAQLNRSAWDYLHRLILLLKSDAIVLQQKRRIWSWLSLPAAITLALYIAVAIWIGWNNGGLILLSFPFAVVAIPLWHWRQREYQRKLPEMSPDAEPFASFRQIREVRQSVSDFKKLPFSHKSPIANLSWLDSISRSVGNVVAWWTGLYLMIMFSPCLLLATCLPLSRYVSELHWPHTDEHDSPTTH